MVKKKAGTGKHCVVYGCTNNSKKMSKWKRSVCQIHSPLDHSDCPCLQPYKMHRLPNGRRPSNNTTKSNNSSDSAAKLKKWLKNINRKDFKPTSDSRLCSIHFTDGQPTLDHPYPVIHMGHDKQLFHGRPVPKRRVLSKYTQADTEIEDLHKIEGEEISVDNKSTQTCSPLQQQNEVPRTKDASIQWYDATLSDHNYADKNDVRKHSNKSTQTVTCPDVTAHDMTETVLKFYTGLSTSVFWEFVNSLLMWLPNAPQFRLKVENQILLVLMRIRLGLMFTDLGVRFNISKSTACEIFGTWLPIMAAYMKENIIFWLPRDTLFRTRPKSFEVAHPKATCIIDCTEIFVQRPKDLMQRAQTYSNYKHHNTYKALYCIAPNGFVTYVSKLFGGRASDTFISKNSGFSEHLLPGDEVLADRGFTISDILPPGVNLSIPAFTKGFKDRLLPEESVTETRRIANVRIHVERAIRRLKCFKILSNIIPGSVKNVDDILVICAGLCNLQPRLINEDNDNITDEEMETDTTEDR